MKLTALILDDETSGCEVLGQFLKKDCPEVEIIGTVSSIEEGIKFANEYKPDILFLDNRVGNDLGLDIIPFLCKPLPHIIVTTAYQEFAIKAIKAKALDYLLKPVVSDELKAAVGKVKNVRQEAISSKQPVAIISREKRIAVPSVDGLIFINTQDVIRCEASGSYSVIYLKPKGQIIISVGIGAMEEMLPSHLGFFRVHHSSIINVSEVVKYVKNDGGYVVLSDKSKVSVSQRKKTRFLDFIKDLA